MQKSSNMLLPIAWGCMYLSINLFSQQINTNSKISEPIKNPTPWLTTRQDLLKLLPKNAIVAEIGVEAGIFSSAILNITNPKHLFLIDCWEEQPKDVFPENRPERLQNYLYQLVQQKFAFNKNVTIIKDFSTKAASLFPDNYFDWIYIDANHSYDGVKEDLETWFAKVKNGGFITGHDYFILDRNDPKYAHLAKNLFDNNYYGVVKAVNEFVVNHNLKIEYLTTEFNFREQKVPSFAIRIIK